MELISLVITIIMWAIAIIAIFILSKRWGKGFFLIAMMGIIIFLLELVPGLGLSIGFIVIMSYLAKKFGDFKK